MIKESCDRISISDNISLKVIETKCVDYEIISLIIAYNSNEFCQSYKFELGKIRYRVYPRESKAYLLDFFIEEECRCRGIGTRIYRWLENYLMEKYSIKVIYIFFVEKEGRPFWQKVGFVGNKKVLQQEQNGVLICCSAPGGLDYL